MYKLIIEDDEGKTTVVPLIRDEITIGRKEGNTIRLTERNVSRRHAKLSRQNGAVYVEDLASYNGIRVNGARISGRIAVGEGDRIQIGDYLLALRLDRTQPTGKRDPFQDAKTQPMERPTEDIPLPGMDGDTVRVEGIVGGEQAAAAERSAAPEPVLDAAPTVP